ncbi:uncharacterized protein [Battus philenor]|uniref:uncharacterized protein n=1 Tax=Battus philenor TaxID=42288 RepID=UPI0035D080A9
MSKLTLIIFAVITSVAFFRNAGTSDPTQHKVGIPDDTEEEGVAVDKTSVVVQGDVLVYDTNRPKPQLQAPNPPTQRPGPLVDVVECIVCVDCPKVDENTTSKLCPHTLDVTRQNRCVAYAEQYKHMKRSWHIRGCASERGSCEDIRKAHSAHSDIVELMYCYECDGDKCNTSSGFRSLSDMTLALVAMIVAPVVTKYTLS